MMDPVFTFIWLVCVFYWGIDSVGVERDQCVGFVGYCYFCGGGGGLGVCVYACVCICMNVVNLSVSKCVCGMYVCVNMSTCIHMNTCV